MALQVALLGEKVGAADEALAASCAGHLTSLKNQIIRINEVMRRYVDVADPAPSSGFDAGSLLADAAQLFGHEARRRRIALLCEASSGAVHAAGDPVRTARLLLGLLWSAVSCTGDGGRLLARAFSTPREARLVLEHTRGVGEPGSAELRAVVAAGAAEMGGRLEESSEDDLVRAALVLPKERM